MAGGQNCDCEVTGSTRNRADDIWQVVDSESDTHPCSGVSKKQNAIEAWNMTVVRARGVNLK